MTKNTPTSEGNWTDLDDAPEMTVEVFKRADYYEGEKLVRRGRPPVDKPKQQLSIRLDADTVEQIRALGPGWQAQLREAIQEWVLHRKDAPHHPG